ncbi:zinc ribbon domain-containing protein [Uliginosibacterium flavum]|uniref:Zinc ribbon domain-containing protein n=1 Tax=Uliginosibacterium flavum TaxID=1396831 RepID=A0ABV2TNW6_9RHOO
MPIYEYRCADCGHKKDHLQKHSDAPIAACPACGSPTYAKQLSAAGFQLKGSGWYATDFKGGSKNSTSSPASNGTTTAAVSEPSTATPAPACAKNCACH